MHIAYADRGGLRARRRRQLAPGAGFTTLCAASLAAVPAAAARFGHRAQIPLLCASSLSRPVVEVLTLNPVVAGRPSASSFADRRGRNAISRHRRGRVRALRAPPRVHRSVRGGTWSMRPLPTNQHAVAELSGAGGRPTALRHALAVSNAAVAPVLSRIGETIFPASRCRHDEQLGTSPWSASSTRTVTAPRLALACVLTRPLCAARAIRAA